jgi:hypothetical protein
MAAGDFLRITTLTLCAVLGICVPLAASQTPSPVGVPTAVDPCSQVNGAVGAGGPCDTPQTPIAKRTTLWTQVAGAVYPGAGSPGYDPARSPTRAIDDLFAVGFRNASFGFAGGAACDDPKDDVLTCKRHPVMYRYSDTDGQGPKWRLDTGFPGGHRGFVGAISYIPHTDRFLAVGGDGCYPRREEPCPDGIAADGPDAIAGRARAWLFSGGEWTEITSELPTHNAAGSPRVMLGMDALDFTATAAAYGYQEYGVAGALGQLWVWKDGRFTGDEIDADSPPAALKSSTAIGRTAAAADFRFRVRDIRAPVDPSGRLIRQGRFLAVTAGCSVSSPCVVDPSVNASSPQSPQYDHSVLLSDGINSADGSDQWTISNNLTAYVPTDPRLVSAYAVEYGFNGVTGAPTKADASGNADLVNADGPESLAEPATGSSGVSRFVAPVRLVSADGLSTSGSTYDWDVGENRSTGQGVIYGANATPSQPNGGICAGSATSLAGCTSGDPIAGQQPSVDAKQEQAALGSYRLLEPGTYGLNAVRMSNGEDGGAGFAVGDRGAIVQLGETAPQAGTEPSPPPLGNPTPGALTNTGAYDAYRQLVTGNASGEVPALATQPLQALGQPGPVAAGSGRPASPPFVDVTSIVMSRDGSEGWAVGGTKGLALDHYDGSHWSSCDPIGAPPLIKPDPRCAGLSTLAAGDLRLLAAARVPYEHADPSHADDFEVVAVGSYNPQHVVNGDRLVVVRYRNGVWAPEDPNRAPIPPTGSSEVVLTSVAFGAPDDGWALGTRNDSGGNAPIYHYDGRRWVDCANVSLASSPADCADGGRLPRVAFSDGNVESLMRVTAVGSRFYLSGARPVKTNGVSADYPLILCHDPGGQWTAAGCGYDPGFDPAACAQSGAPDLGNATAGNAGADHAACLQGEVFSLAVSKLDPTDDRSAARARPVQSR